MGKDQGIAADGQGRFAAFAALALSMTLVGANVPLAKYLGAHLPVVWIGFVRALVASLLLLPLVRLAGPLAWPRGHVLALAGLGVCGVVAYPVLLVVGLQSTGALEAGFIAATLPATVAVMALFVLREKLTSGMVLAIALATAGLAALNLASLGDAAGAPGSMIGNALVFLAVVFEAGYVILARRLAPHLAPSVIAFWGNAAATLAFVPALAFAPLEPALAAPAIVWAGVAFFSVSSSVIALMLWFYGAARVPAAVSGLFTICLPLSAAAIAVFIVGERAGPLALVAAVLILLALIVGTRPARP